MLPKIYQDLECNANSWFAKNSFKLYCLLKNCTSDKYVESLKKLFFFHQSFLFSWKAYDFSYDFSYIFFKRFLQSIQIRYFSQKLSSPVTNIFYKKFRPVFWIWRNWPFKEMHIIGYFGQWTCVLSVVELYTFVRLDREKYTFYCQIQYFYQYWLRVGIAHVKL